MFMKFVLELVEFIAIVWIVRFVLNQLMGSGPRKAASFQPTGQPTASAPAEKVGEMKKCPQCGTYVATELSLKARHRGEPLYFCSPQCQETYLQAQSGRSA